MLLNLNVMFGIDRAGLVPGDGETHQGIHDIGIFANYNNTVVVSPSNYSELLFWQEYLINNVKGPKVLRYSRGGQDDNTKEYICKNSSIYCFVFIFTCLIKIVNNYFMKKFIDFLSVEERFINNSEIFLKENDFEKNN